MNHGRDFKIYIFIRLPSFERFPAARWTRPTRDEDLALVGGQCRSVSISRLSSLASKSVSWTSLPDDGQGCELDPLPWVMVEVQLVADWITSTWNRRC